MLIKDAQHTFYGFGRNDRAQLGDSNNQWLEQSRLRKLHTLNTVMPPRLRQKVVSIATSQQQTLLLLSDGLVWCVAEGGGFICQGPRDIKAIACGGFFNVFVNAANRVFTDGSNEQGELGLGHTDPPINRPTDVFDDDGEFDIAHELEVHCGYNHTLIFDVTAMRVVAFGDNQHGVIGKGQPSGYDKAPIPCKPYELSKKNNLNVVHVAAGALTTLLLTQENDLFWCGDGHAMAIGGGTESPTAWTPTLISKQEIGISDRDHITRVVAGDDSVIVIVNEN